MRCTEICFAQHLGAAFRALWVIQAKMRVIDTGAKAMLNAQGIEVFDPKDILTPVFENPQIHKLPPLLATPESIPAPVDQPQCHMFTNRTSPIAGLHQCQLITNSLVRESLPQDVLELSVKKLEGEEELVKQAILHAHLLDAHQDKLPRVIDMNRPGINLPLEYGLTLNRKNKNLSYQWLVLLDQFVPSSVGRHIVENTTTQVTLKHSGRLMNMNHRAAFIVAQSSPLLATMGPMEVEATKTQELPDIYPLSPFANVYARPYSNLQESFGIPSARLHPHTIFIHHNQPYMKCTVAQFPGLSLLSAFSHSVSYAMKFGKVLDSGILENPVTINIVHTNGRLYHIGMFQLNSLDLTGSIKNVFWSQPIEKLYDSCMFRGAKPLLEGYNPKVFSLIKSIYSRGL